LGLLRVEPFEFVVAHRQEQDRGNLQSGIPGLVRISG
jgi:hypothetical protein